MTDTWKIKWDHDTVGYFGLAQVFLLAFDKAIADKWMKWKKREQSLQIPRL